VTSCLPAAGDAAAALVALGAQVAREGLSADPEAALVAPPPIDPRVVVPWIAALHRHAARREREDAAWRSERDLARRATSWIAAVTGVLRDPPTLSAHLGAPVPAPRAEAFYVRALVHGHHLATAGLSISLALRDRAVRLLVARAMQVLFAELPPEALDPACAHPLALLEAMLRGHGLDAYAPEVAREVGG
jgi:lysine-N-methylase